jgi:hypothetical protein
MNNRPVFFSILFALISLAIGGISLDGCSSVTPTPTPRVIYINNPDPLPTPFCLDASGQPSTNCVSPMEAQSLLATAEFGRQELERQLTAIAIEDAQEMLPNAPEKPVVEQCLNTNGCE